MKAELTRINRELKRLRTQIAALEDRRQKLTTEDESRIVFRDADDLMDDPRLLAAGLSRIPERILEPLERHRLTAFYEDGEEHVKGAMRLREILAMKQYLSDTPIKPYQVIRELLGTAPLGCPSKPGASRPWRPFPAWRPNLR